MPTADEPIQPVELYVITPLDILTVTGVGMLLALLAAGFAVWLFWPGKPAPEVDSPESAETVELPQPRRHPSTGTICVPRDRVPVDDATVVLDVRRVRDR